MNKEEYLYWIALLQCTSIGSQSFYKLYSYFQNIKNVFDASVKELKNAGLSEKQIHNFLQHKNSISLEYLNHTLIKEDVHIITIYDSDYPPLLKQIHNPPPLLFYKGNIHLCHKNLLAVVGARKHTDYGKKLINMLLPECTQELVIVSGLAYGIDSLAHAKTLEHEGETVAVLASGLNDESIYPQQNRYLAQKIIDNQGLLLSETFPYVQPHVKQFPLRNRIIAGISQATLIIEAGEKSGSLITAHYALDYNREVLAVPGDVSSPLTKGTHLLLKQGAHVITQSKDILNIFNIEKSDMSPRPKIEPLFTNHIHTHIYSHLNSTPLSLDELALKTSLSIQQLQSEMLFLEMNGHVINNGNTFTKQ